jgi:hypothetical protein
VLRVRNRYTLDEALFNALRARRPLERAPGELENDIAARLAANDMFATPLTHTTADSFGRIKGRYCVSASNVAKFEGWHGLVIFDEGHPLRFAAAQVNDYLEVALRWLQQAHSIDPAARYPLIIWNCLPRSGASIVHGHMQMALAREQHYSQIEHWRRAAVAYGAAHTTPGCKRYFDDLLAVHSDLGLLCYHQNGVQAVASLTPTRNREVLLTAPALGEALAAALTTVLRNLIDQQGVRAFNAAVYLPPFGMPASDWRGFPVIARVVDRGDPLAVSSDLGAVELFASSVISADPFAVAALFRA